MKMKNITTIIVITVFILVLSNNALADHMTGPFQVNSIMTSGLGVHFEVSPTPSQCTGNWWGSQFIIEKDHANYNALTSAILSAFLAGKSIDAIHYTADGNGSCSYGNWLSVTAFKVNY